MLLFIHSSNELSCWVNWNSPMNCLSYFHIITVSCRRCYVLLAVTFWCRWQSF